MKTPRVQDFDPNAKIPSLGSPMDKLPVIQKPPAPVQATKPQPIPERPNDSTPVRPNVRRIITRNSFEIYEDQMESLRRLAYEEKIQGKIGSMSAMVRDAIDTYIKKRSSEK